MDSHKKNILTDEYIVMHIGQDALPIAKEVTLVHEATVTMLLNNRFVLRTQCLASDLEEMVVGFMVSEGVLRERSELERVEIDHASGSINVIAQVPEQRLEQAAGYARVTAGGGRMAVIDLLADKLQAVPRLSSRMRLSSAQIRALYAAFDERSGLYRQSRFVHSAGLADGTGLLCCFDDVGRHNAIDKALGYAFIQELDYGALVLLCSGRFSLEMVAKAASVGIPAFVSPAAPSVEAVSLAEEIGMTLCGRSTIQHCNVYSAAWRITDVP